jgi:large subunit ribosomal protein L21
VYAIVRGGSRQHKVTTGDVLEIDLVEAEVGDTLSLPVILLVDGDKVTSDAESLSQMAATAEVIEETKGPKIKIIKFKNKSGYKKRQGHRQRYTKVKITGIK